MPLRAEAVQVQQRISEEAQRNPLRRFERLHRTLCDEKWLIAAWKQIRGNHGSRTQGVDGETRDDVDDAMIQRLAAKLKKGEYEPHPVRRVYIPKANGKMRPLGIPTIQDRIVQSAIKMMIEPIWEQDFRNCSHGFRPNRSCHTALRAVAIRFPRSTWVIEGDITGCFDNIHHGRLMECLRKRIVDEKLLRLVESFLKAGYMEQWTYHRTYSGTPQGGIISPLLANIFLHELDVFMETTMNSNLYESKKEQNARRDPASRKVSGRIQLLRRKLKDTDRTQEERAEIIKEMKDKERELRTLPNLLFRKATGYIRYADDFLITLQGQSKVQAEETRKKIREFMHQELGLELNPEKTLITHPTKKIRFLGFDLTSKGGRSKRIRLEIPKQARERPLEKISRLCQMTQINEVDLLVQTNSIIRGWMEYYKCASAPQRLFSDMLSKVFWLTAHYMASKHRTSIPKILGTRLRTLTKKGRTRKVLTTTIAGKTYFSWAFPPRTVSIYGQRVQALDVEPTPRTEWARGRSIEDRLIALAETDGRCQGCGTTENLEVHHKGGLRGKTGKAKIQAGKDKTKIVLCRSCHLRIGHGGSYAPRT
jgi:group II intron reverse transcriptase/maturase